MLLANVSAMMLRMPTPSRSKKTNAKAKPQALVFGVRDSMNLSLVNEPRVDVIG
jgi:hypothetical protein